MSRYKVKLVDGSPLEKVMQTKKVKDSILRPVLKLSVKELAIMKRRSGLKGNLTHNQIVQGYIKACLNEG
tara:strand:- start:87 stop:296 length:210 start_codon:yes stop_codon:yes gene_type:complete